MSLSLSLSMSMSFSTSSICMYELHCYECVMHKSYGQHRATQCSQTLLLSSAHAASLHDYVHQLMAQCIRRQRHKPRTAYGEVATWLNLAEYTVSRTVLYPVKTNDGWSCLAMFDSHSASHSESFVGRNRAMADLGVGTGHQFFSPGWCRTAHFFCRAPLLLRQSQQPCYWCAFHKDYSKKQ